MIYLIHFASKKTLSTTKGDHLSDGGDSRDAVDTLLVSSVNKAESELRKWIKRFDPQSRQLLIIVPTEIVRNIIVALGENFPEVHYEWILPFQSSEDIEAILSRIESFWGIKPSEVVLMPSTAQDFWVDPSKLVFWDEDEGGKPTIGHAWIMMKDSKKGHLPLVSKGKLKGLVTWSSVVDLIPVDEEIIGTLRYNKKKIELLQTPLDESRIVRLDRLITVEQNCSVIDLIRAFAEPANKTRYPSILPVVDNDGRLLSLISWVDLFQNFHLLPRPERMPTAIEIGRHVTDENVIKSNYSIQIAVDKVQNNPIPYILVIEPDGSVSRLLSDRDIANLGIGNYRHLDDATKNILITRKCSEIKPRHTLEAITVDPEIPLWAVDEEKQDSLVRRFLDSVSGENTYFNRIGCLLVRSSDRYGYRLITPHDCLQSLL